jgi:phosphoribosylanthranilate isomerase
MTTIKDVEGAVDAGVDALGFIFVESSPRYVDPEKVKEIVKRLPPFVDAVGVFVDEEAEVVDEIVQYCGLTVVQLHGSESPTYCDEIACRVVKAFRIKPASALSENKSYYDPYYGVVNGFLLDTFHEKMAGGTGVTFDWKLLEKIRPLGPLILAGGLTPENVGQAIIETIPFAVDVNSGVEFEPGRKDVERIIKLVGEVRKADKQRV